MDDDMRDEVPVPHFEDELWRTLTEVHAQQRSTAGPDPGPTAGAVRQRRRARRLLLAGVGSIAAAAVALAAIVTTGSDGSPDGPDTETAEPGDDTPPPTEAPEMSLAAQITAASEEASATSLIHKVTDNQYTADDGSAIGDEEQWTDEQSGAMRSLGYDSEGQPSFDTGRAVAPGVDDPGPPPLPPDATPFDPSLPQERLRQVDHCFGEYREYDQTAIPGQIEADQIGESLAAGDLVEDGTVVRDGRELIRLVEVPVDLRAQATGLPPAGTPTTEPSGSSDASGSSDSSTTTTAATPPDPDTFEYVEHIFLVDAETFRPVHVIGYPGEAADYSDAMYIATIEYLPRTPENLALLAAPVPAGYQLVPDLRGDGERYEACGW